MAAGAARTVSITPTTVQIQMPHWRKQKIHARKQKWPWRVRPGSSRKVVPETEMPASEEAGILFDPVSRAMFNGRIGFDGNATAKTFVIAILFQRRP
jgi:hypothetical protein